MVFSFNSIFWILHGGIGFDWYCFVTYYVIRLAFLRLFPRREVGGLKGNSHPRMGKTIA